MTELSEHTRFGLGARQRARTSEVVARAVLWIALAAQVGCLVDDPPAYQSPRRTTPLLTAQTPPATKFVRAPPDSQLDLRIRFQAEDAGDRLRIDLYLDFFTPDEVRVDGREYPASAFDDVRTTDNWSWTVDRITRRCHTLTAVAYHASNQIGVAPYVPECAKPTQLEPGDPPCFADPLAVTTLTWWLDTRATSDTDPLEVDECPGGPLRSPTGSR